MTFRFLVFVPASGPAALCEGGVYTDDATILASCEEYRDNTIAAGKREAAGLDARAAASCGYELRDTLAGCAPLDDDVRSSLVTWMLSAAIPTIGSPVERMLAAIPWDAADSYAFQVGYLTSFLDGLAGRLPEVAKAISERTDAGNRS